MPSMIQAKRAFWTRDRASVQNRQQSSQVILEIQVRTSVIPPDDDRAVTPLVTVIRQCVLSVSSKSILILPWNDESTSNLVIAVARSAKERCAVT